MSIQAIPDKSRETSRAMRRDVPAQNLRIVPTRKNGGWGTVGMRRDTNSWPQFRWALPHISKRILLARFPRRIGRPLSGVPRRAPGRRP